MVAGGRAQFFCGDRSKMRVGNEAVLANGLIFKEYWTRNLAKRDVSPGRATLTFYTAFVLFAAGFIGGYLERDNFYRRQPQCGL